MVSSHEEMFDRAVDLGHQRLQQSTLELVSTSLIAGYTIVFGMLALGIVHAAVSPEFGELARIAGALAFGVGLVFLVGGETELFAENILDPAAAVLDRRDPSLLVPLARLWSTTFVCNLLGGVVLVVVLAVPGTLPPGTGEALATTAEEIAHRTLTARLASSIVGGALVALLSFLLAALDDDWSRLGVAYVTGVLLALGPLDHVIVSTLHVALGAFHGAAVEPVHVAELVGVGTVGNLLGGVALVTTTHVAQGLGAREDSANDA